MVLIIYSKFNNLKPEKQKQIINAAIKEFVRNGFEKASTNEIVKRANISKGSLFNYFNSKKDLYLYLIEYSSKAIVNLNEEIDLSETDLFKRIERVALQKFYVQQKYPQAFEFLASTKQEESVEVKDIIKQRLNPIYNQAINKLYKDIDYSKFREGVDIEKAIEILNWTMFGVGEKGLKELFTFDDIGRFGEKYLEEWNVYAELLKYSFYK
ncbi:TPA: TetR/AcrR family transcriptional regulator [Streptococcus pyogenes]|uniref:TetR/AcrR family transcriptional regulator n=2 Tax=Bacillota TaxID=1239 RepID=UPI0000D7586F|nr:MULTISPECIES: TetR/AcrR family transcriptional regulator [Bacillota]MDK7802051.1 TetR/AcrR family transcriptional regulator [Aerococcus urinae]MDU5150191.1 TetR/AcrR family transcriptional regulator [Anaerococcus prevotii]ABF38650.1 Transcriptional regulator, TetR family [Streptococcus pyogenes MGAS10750]KXA48588.1 transcriptional regulator, TetR family [Streptococcus agalactiae]KXA55481.1 transcriptional regulator, TetR family [Streptococcus agalactiae]